MLQVLKAKNGLVLRAVKKTVENPRGMKAEKVVEIWIVPLGQADEFVQCVNKAFDWLGESNTNDLES